MMNTKVERKDLDKVTIDQQSVEYLDIGKFLSISTCGAMSRDEEQASPPVESPGPSS